MSVLLSERTQPAGQPGRKALDARGDEWEVAVEPERRPAMEFSAAQFVWLNLGHSPFSVTEHLVLSEPPDGWIGRTGEFTTEVLRICLPRPDRRALYFVCGPLPKMDSVEVTLTEMGAPRECIVSERFKYN